MNDRLLSDITPCMMFPPVSPKRCSRSTGESTCRAITDRLKLGAYSFIRSKQRSAYFSFSASSDSPGASRYGEYWVNIDITYLPGGGTVSSSTDGIVASMIGCCDGRPYLASSYARSMY